MGKSALSIFAVFWASSALAQHHSPMPPGQIQVVSAGQEVSKPGSITISGVMEAMPDRIYRIMPYNDWPLLQISVHEGQRLHWNREKGGWVGDSPIVTTQFETPAEIETYIIESEKAIEEARLVALGSEKAIAQAQTALEQSRIRERNARQEFNRQNGLRQKNQQSEEAYQKSKNLLELTEAELKLNEKLAEIEFKKSTSEQRLAKLMIEKRKSELDFANFKRDMSWGRVPVGILPGKTFERKQAVVTQVNARIGDQPPRSGPAPVWVELVDDSILMARTTINPNDEATTLPGQTATITQANRTYEGEVLSLLPVVESGTQRIPVLIKVKNHDLRLRIGSSVQIQLEGNQP